MVASILPPNDEQDLPQVSPRRYALLVTAVHEDEATEDCARRMMERVLAALGRDVVIANYTCNFQVFAQPEGRASAARQARLSDIVIVSAYDDGATLAPVTDWLEHWLAPRRNVPGALVAVSVRRSSGSWEGNSMEDQLGEVARRVGMDFFSTHALNVHEAA